MMIIWIIVPLFVFSQDGEEQKVGNIFAPAKLLMDVHNSIRGFRKWGTKLFQFMIFSQTYRDQLLGYDTAVLRYSLTLQQGFPDEVSKISYFS